MQKKPFLLNLEIYLPCSRYLRFHVSQICLSHTTAVIRTLSFSLTLLSYSLKYASWPQALSLQSLHHTTARLSFLKSICVESSFSWTFHGFSMSTAWSPGSLAAHLGPVMTCSCPPPLSHLLNPWSFRATSSSPKWLVLTGLLYLCPGRLPTTATNVMALPSLPDKHSYFRLSSDVTFHLTPSQISPW